MKKCKLFFSVLTFLLLTSSILQAKPITESTTGLTVDAPKKYKLSYKDGVYTIRKKRSKNKASFVIGKSPLSAKLTAEDFIKSSGMKVTKFNETDDSVILKGKLKKKKVEIRFRPVGDEMEIVTYPGKKKKKNKRFARSIPRITAGAIRALDRIIRTRQGGTVIPLPITVPVRQFSGNDGTSALVPDLPGWRYDAQDGIVTGGNPDQGIINLGVPALVITPNAFGNYGIVSQFTTAANAIATVWPQQAKTLGVDINVVGISKVPGTDGWLGPEYASSALFTIRFQNIGKTWDGLMVSGTTPIDGFSWLWYHSYIAVPVGSSPAMGTTLMNTWATWNNTNANLKRLQDALNTINTTALPGNPIDPAVFDAINEEWLDYIKK